MRLSGVLNTRGIPETLQADLDAWVDAYNYERSHQGKMCCGRTPMQTLLEGLTLWVEKVSELN